MKLNNEFAEGLAAALAATPEENGDDRMKNLLESRGFAHAARSATNLRLLAVLFPAEILHFIAETALSTPSPDMALNGLERISVVLPREDLPPLCASKVRLSQLLTLCGSSPFLTGIICRDPALFRPLFLEGGIELRRGEAEMLAALRGQVGGGTGCQDLLPQLRRFKVAEILRIAARDLNGLAPLEEVTAELSALGGRHPAGRLRGCPAGPHRGTWRAADAYPVRRRKGGAGRSRHGEIRRPGAQFFL